MMTLTKTLVAVFVSQCLAVDLQLQNSDSVKSALGLIAKGLMDYSDAKNVGGVPGMMVPPYYWWEAGAAWNSMIDYWHFTGDDQYNDIVQEGMLYQVGKNSDYMPSNQTTTEGNDDQGFWGITVMSAAERNFSNPKSDQPQWLALAQAVFNTMASRWDQQHCGGGLRWQIYTWNSGYDYKNTVSNGCLFHIGARLARYTDNSSYSDWSEKVYDWITEVGYLRENEGYTLYDGGSIDDNCTSHTQILWSYNYGLLLSGCAYMYDYTNDTKWLDRTTELWKASGVFFKNGIMFEAACQPSGRCNNDQRCFKSIFSRFLGLTATLVPSLKSDILDMLDSSAEAAAKSCSGGSDGHTCGLNWFTGGWDQVYGLGEQMSALDVIQNTLVRTKDTPPLSNQTGGTSKGDPSAGGGSRTDLTGAVELQIETKDKAGAGIVTILILGGFLGTGFWMLK